jgi:hypothetical protein
MYNYLVKENHTKFNGFLILREFLILSKKVTKSDSFCYSAAPGSSY